MNMRNGFLKFTLLLSILVGVIPPIFHERLFDKNEVDITLPDRWNQMSTREKLDCVGELLSKNESLFLLSEIKQLNVRRHLRKMIVDNEDAVLRNGFQYTFGFRYDLGWKELSLLGAAGFASVWALYAVTNVIILLIPSKVMVHFPMPPLRGRIKSLNFLFHDKEPRRPPKPTAVWID